MEYNDFRSAAASFGKMTGTGVLKVRVRANFPTKIGSIRPVVGHGEVHVHDGRADRRAHGRFAGIPALLLGSEAGTKQYRVQIANREDLATTVENVITDNTSYAPT